MRSLIFIMLMTLLWFSSSIAQVVGGKDDKLAQLYASGKYESCLFKADNMTYRESSSHEPEPYLYVAMCYYKLSMSDDPILRDDYKDGFKQAIAYIGKFIRKDKEGILYDENIGFINTLKDEQLKKINKYFQDMEYKKAAIAAKSYNKLNRENDETIVYFIGACEMLSKNNPQGELDMSKAQTILNEKIKAGTLKTDPRFTPLLASVFLKYSENLVLLSQLESASTILSYGLKMMPDEGYLKLQLNMIEKKMQTQIDSLRQ